MPRPRSCFSVLLTDLLKAFDCLSHKFLVAKLIAKQRTKTGIITGPGETSSYPEYHKDQC